MIGSGKKGTVNRAREYLEECLKGVFKPEAKAEVLEAEIFTTLFEPKRLIEIWEKDFGRIKPHDAVG